MIIMNQPFETELITYRRSWRAHIVNNEYHYIGGDNYTNNTRTVILNNIPQWYNTDLIDNNSYSQNGSTKLCRLFEGNAPGIIQYGNNNDITYDNTTDNWIISDGELHSHSVIVTDELNLDNIITHLNMIREHYQYDNINEIINEVRSDILQYINIDG
jgi:hypothetical protein